MGTDTTASPLTRRRLLTLTAAAVSPLIASRAYAQKGSAGFITNSGKAASALTLVVPYSAGGPLDRASRRLAQDTTSIAHMQVINVTGAGGSTGAAMVARAGARDPLLLMGAAGTHAILPWLNPQLPYDPLRDFQPLNLVARMPHVLVMRSELAQQWRIQTPDDLLRFMARNRQPLRYASAGNGSIGHIAGKLFQTLTRVPLQHLPFAGAQPAMSALLEGSSDLMFDNIASCLPHIRAGRLKALGVTSAAPLPMLPGVPVLGESIRGLELTTWFGLFATAGISDAQASCWANAFARTLQQPAVQQYFDAMGVIREDLRLQDFAQLVQADHRFYGQLIRNNLQLS